MLTTRGASLTIWLCPGFSTEVVSLGKQGFRSSAKGWYCILGALRQHEPGAKQLGYCTSAVDFWVLREG